MYTAAMGFTSDACWFFLIKMLLIKNNKKREAALKNEASGDKKHCFFYLASLLSLIVDQIEIWYTESSKMKMAMYQSPDLLL